MVCIGVAIGKAHTGSLAHCKLESEFLELRAGVTGVTGVTVVVVHSKNGRQIQGVASVLVDHFSQRRSL